MRVYGTASITDLLGDFLAYRSLQPIDARLPRIADLRARLRIAANQPLRKGDTNYARVAAELLRAARSLSAPGAELRRLIALGDTRMSDGGMFISLCTAAGWQGRAFIGGEQLAKAPQQTREDDIIYANRWALLRDFAASLDAEKFAIDASTAIVIDLDKTLIGARGRNDHLIDTARLTALRVSVADVLGDAFDSAAFEQAYHTLNQTRFHSLTGDNQDCVAYLCVIVLGEVFRLSHLIDTTESNHQQDFALLLRQIDNACDAVGWPSPAIETFHHQIADLVDAGDPTPFKAFRRCEYQETAALMGQFPDDTAPEQLLREELTLTGEVWEIARAWQARGALLFGLSDKPDEAAIPSEELAAQGALRLDQITTHIVGE
jgi:hypothetical protein